MKQARTIIALALVLVAGPAVALDGGRGIDIALRCGDEHTHAAGDVAAAGQVPDANKIVGVRVAILDPVSKEPIFLRAKGIDY